MRIDSRAPYFEDEQEPKVVEGRVCPKFFDEPTPKEVCEGCLNPCLLTTK